MTDGTPFDLSSRVALVTGAGGGLGSAIACALAAAGADVALHDLVEGPRLQRVAERASAIGRRVSILTGDVRDAAAVAGFVGDAIADLGRIDVLVNNAGVMTETPFMDLTESEWRLTLDTNLTGMFLCARAVLPQMLERGSGAVINIGSQLAQKGAARVAHYAAAKGGALAFTRSLAAELAPRGIRVNAIAPGPLDTEMLDPYRTSDWLEAKTGSVALRRLGRPDEIGPSVVFLASEASSLYVGQTLCPNGGGVMT